jgi:hypothetical protein
VIHNPRREDFIDNALSRRVYSKSNEGENEEGETHAVTMGVTYQHVSGHTPNAFPARSVILFSTFPRNLGIFAGRPRCVAIKHKVPYTTHTIPGHEASSSDRSFCLDFLFLVFLVFTLGTRKPRNHGRKRRKKPLKPLQQAPQGTPYKDGERAGLHAPG